MGLSTVFLRFCQEKALNSCRCAICVPLRQKGSQKNKNNDRVNGMDGQAEAVAAESAPKTSRRKFKNAVMWSTFHGQRDSQKVTKSLLTPRSSLKKSVNSDDTGMTPARSTWARNRMGTPD